MQVHITSAGSRNVATCFLVRFDDQQARASGIPQSRINVNIMRPATAWPFMPQVSNLSIDRWNFRIATTQYYLPSLTKMERKCLRISLEHVEIPAARCTALLRCSLYFSYRKLYSKYGDVLPSQLQT